MDARANLGVATVATAPSPATSGTSLTVTAGQGANLPVGTFQALVGPASYSLPADRALLEIVRCTRTAGSDVVTLVRAQEGTNARTIVAGDVLSATVTKRTLDDIDARIGRIFDVRAYGAVCDDSTYDAPAVQAAVDAAAAAGGGTVRVSGKCYVWQTTITVPSLVRLEGFGPENSWLRCDATSTNPVVDFSGTGTGYNGHNHLQGMANMSLKGGGAAATLLRAYYVDNARFCNVYFHDNTARMVDAVELWDTQFNQCVWLTGGGPAGSALPMVHLRNASAASGFGSGTDNSNMVWFTDCRLEDFAAGALWVEKGTGGVSNPNGIFLNHVKFETHRTGGAPIFFDGDCQHVALSQIEVYVGAFAGGYSTPVPVIRSLTGIGFSARDVRIVTGEAATTTRGLDVACAVGPLTVDGITHSSTGTPAYNPTQGVVYLATTPPGFELGTVRSSDGAQPVGPAGASIGSTVRARSFGVVADGTTDDTAAWQAVMTAIGTSAVTLEFPAGVSVCDGDVVKICTGQTFVRPNLKLKAAATSPRLLSTRDLASFTGTENGTGHRDFKIIDARLDGNAANNTGIRPLGLIPATPTASTTTGTLAAGDYTYRVTAYNARGETMASARVIHTLAATGGVSLSWTATAGATGYHIYGRSWSQDKHYRWIGTTTGLTFVDNGSVTPGRVIQGRVDMTGGALCHLHGYDFVLGCEVLRSPGVGIFTEWQGTTPAVGDRMEATFTDIGATSCWGAGFGMWGPHDSVCTGRAIFALNGLANVDTIDNVVTIDYGPMIFGYLHTWGQARYGLAGYTMTTVTEGELEGAKVANAFVYSDRFVFSGNVFYPDTATTEGIVVGDSAYSPPGSMINVKCYGRPGVAFATDVDLTYAGAGHQVNVISDRTSGSALAVPISSSAYGVVNVSTPRGVDTQTTVDAAGAFVPKDIGLLAAAFDPAAAVTTSTVLPSSGVLYLIRVRLDRPQLVTNIVIAITTAGATLTANQNKAALYDAAGALIGTTGDQSTAWTSTGMKTMALAGGAVTLNTGYYWIALWANGTTRPAFVRGNSALVVNGVLAAASARWATCNNGITTTAPATLGTRTASNTAYWAGLS